MFERRFVCVDLETTGANAAVDRITEIAIVEVADGAVVGEWSSLVNPQRAIPPLITSLTGIDDAMVRDAPTFAELCDEVASRLEGRLFVAHNARFDAGFLKSAFSREERRFDPEVLCTVKLSRKLYPQHQRHNLDSLITRHGLDCGTDRHRALTDARLVWQFLQTVRREHAPTAIAEALVALLKTPVLPAQLDADNLAGLPASVGVYLFFGENDAPLYVGKSANLRAQVQAHFGAKGAKAQRLAQQLRRVDWIECAGELGAQLTEARLVKQLRPQHNRPPATNDDLCAWHWRPGSQEPPRLHMLAGRSPAEFADLFGLFRGRREAVNALRRLAENHGLCLYALGLESGSGPCFARQAGRCAGYCLGRESAARHDARLASALAGMKLRDWPWPGRIGVRETHPSGGRVELHVFDQWCYLGTLREGDDPAELNSAPAFDADLYRLLNSRLKQRPAPRVVPL